ncbi:MULTISPECIES: hypothetical protein [Vibrio]|uniref:hypothetical protein n=1 Tax=Vibrio TaxID=662 RepID=UPI001121885A|nr:MULTISPECIES: hypothetical protein [Vibrio]EJM7154690.1 hypothetical protein [Vibrio parahaemolyticus]EJS2611045.1 hypothetical protein [Vibrio alginolyticus]MCA2452346.1 hypothetical protein [Vibrio alginolyticus]MCA2476347.1 hypothetical protein [Vibrio alginolyticus]MDW1568106.1 hypothetical protein [Vibrio sp. YT-15]
MKKVKLSVAASILAVSLSGCSTQLPVKPVTQHYSFGPEQSAKHTVTFEYQNLASAPEYQNYEITLNLDSLPQQVEFDLCQFVEASNNCKSTIKVWEESDSRVWIDYQMIVPTELKQLKGTDILAVDTKGLVGRSAGEWGEELPSGKTTVYQDGEQNVTYHLTILTN